MRPRWDEYFLNIAEAVAERSPCLRRKVGAVIVRENKIISTGYNGPPSGKEHCKECPREEYKSGEKLGLCRATHAEINALRQTHQGDTIYVTTEPCSSCWAVIRYLGMKVVFKSPYKG